MRLENTGNPIDRKHPLSCGRIPAIPGGVMQKRVAEFFAGIGLMRMGLDQAGWTTVWANDIDEKKWEMYRANYNEGYCEFILGDVHAVKGADMPDFELATASFPCNDLSLAGSRHGLAGTHSSAFWGFIDTIKGMGKRRPRFILLENVVGFLTSHDGNDFREALTALNELGYSVDAMIVDAARFVPQSRQRLFVIGVKDTGVSPRIEDLGLLQSDARPAALADFIFMNPEIRWNVRPLPPLPRSGRRLRDIVEDVPLNSELWWSRDRCEYLLNQMSPKHRGEAQAMMDGAEWSYGTVFRRVRNGRSMAELRTDGIAGCLRTPRGGSGRQILFCAGKGQFRVRLVTPRECSRLMGADEFKIKATLNQALFGFGDAVCVPVIRWIAENYLNLLIEESEPERTSVRIAQKPVVYKAKRKVRAKHS
jgi:DNA (cytosine-5)-methyltransferase 1